MELKWSVGVGKRSREHDDGLKRMGWLSVARAATEVIMAIELKDLEDPAKRTQLPYPGHMNDFPGPRPGTSVLFIGRKAFSILRQAFGRLLPGQHLALTGPKGIGKSCYLRALACCLIKEKVYRVVCIWNLELARRKLGKVLRQALEFGFYNSPHLKDIDTVEDILGFLVERESLGDQFVFIIDSAQALDVKTSGPEAATRSMMSEALSELTLERRVVWGLSPRAAAAQNEDPHTLAHISFALCDSGFDEEEYETYMKASVLGTVMLARQADIHYYAGRHPWLLEVLGSCCNDLAHKEGVVDMKSFLVDDENWEAVLDLFMQHREVEWIRKTIRRFRLDATCHTLEAVTSLDPRYTLKKGVFCSLFIQKLYIEEFRNLEEKRLVPTGAWLPYCRQPIDNYDLVNWAEIGWLCEALVGDVIAKKGININGSMIGSGALQKETFIIVPTISPELLGPGCGYYFWPARYNYGSVDGVIIWRDLVGNFDMFAIQVTVNRLKHMHSVGEFMAVGVVKQWIPEIFQRRSEWQLHCVFICLEDSAPVAIGDDLKGTRGSLCYGTFGYTLHIISLQAAFLNKAENASKVVEDMVTRRENQFSHVTPVATATAAAAAPTAPAKSRPEKLSVSRKELEKWRRRDLNDLAEKHFLPHDKHIYPNIQSLRDGFIAEGNVFDLVD